MWTVLLSNVPLLTATMLLPKAPQNASVAVMVIHVSAQQAEMNVQKDLYVLTIQSLHVQKVDLDRLPDSLIVTCVIYAHQVSCVQHKA